MDALFKQKNWTLIWIYIANLILSLHYYLIIYINSSYLEQYFSKQGIGLLYIAGSILNILLFIETPKLLKRFGNWHFVLVAIILEFLTVLGMAFVQGAFTAGWLFVINFALIALILFSLDIFLEETTKEERVTGELRSMYLTLSNLALVISPGVVGLIGDTNFSNIYLLSAVVTIPLLILVFFKLRIPIVKITHIQIRETISEVTSNNNIRNVTIAQLALQFFYAWMVVYMPIYMNEVIGFSWTELGPLFSLMLLPFILFEIPIGWFADRGYGEKSFMVSGILIIGISMIVIPFITAKSFVLWATVLFISRVGASFTEITTESYFFKHVGARNANVISLFRVMRPLSFILMPIIFNISLLFLSFRHSFFVLAFFIILSVMNAKRIAL